MNNTLTAMIVDPVNQTKDFGQINQIKACKSGLLGKIVGTNFNVYRPWNQTSWLTNVTSSTRFNLETEGMTSAEVAIFMVEEQTATSKLYANG